MDRQSQNKVIDAGFTIIRKDDYPSPRIKARSPPTRISGLMKNMRARPNVTGRSNAC